MTLTYPVSASLAVKVPTGTALKSEKDIPTVFTPIKIRGLELQNRFIVAPMGTWSAQDGHTSDFHLVHLGAFAFRGASLTIIESTVVAENGRTSPQDAGLWKDSQIPPLKRAIDFIHAQGQKAGIQLNHAGAKASMVARFTPYTKQKLATKEEGGWPEDVWAPSPIPHSEEYVVPKTLTKERIEEVIQNFGDAARRAVEAGVDFVEIHGAHGYLINQFMSPLTNQRNDEYGGSFENRIRFLVRVIQAIRKELPDSTPLSVRISAVEWMEWSGRPSWDLDQSIKLAKLLPEYGVDILDVSSAGNHKDQKIDVHPNYQIDLARAIRTAIKKDGIKLLIAAVGFINTPQIARDVVQNAGTDKEASGVDSDFPSGDLAFIGRQFLREPEFVLRSAQELGAEIQRPYQYEMIRPRDAKRGSS